MIILADRSYYQILQILNYEIAMIQITPTGMNIFLHGYSI
jgi:hypothetical protein